MAPSPHIRRLLKETAELSTEAKNPNPAFHAAPVSDNDLTEWHFTLFGPPSPSPYANGLYHGRISLPSGYPLKPPNFRFLTPSGRFEVNREICLSISGFHEETWMPAWGVRTALVALRSFMAEKGEGQVGGLEASTEVRKKLAQESKSWRCDACGKTNQQVMNEWWAACRTRGVNIEEETALEALPEGVNLIPRNRSKEVEKVGKTEDGTEDVPIAAQEMQRKEDAIPVQDGIDSSDALLETPTSNHSRTISHPSVHMSAAPQGLPPPPIQARTEARLQDQSASSTGRSVSQAQLPQSRSQQQPQRQPITQVAAPLPAESGLHTPTIDKAIGILLLALLFMIFRKYFYTPDATDNDIDGWFETG